MRDTNRPTSLAGLAALLSALPGLVACATIGPELSPEKRAFEDGWVVSLHAKGSGTYQVVVQHPPGRFSGPPGAVKGHLEGETVKPSTWGVTRRTTTSSGDGGYMVSLAGNSATVEPLPATTVEETRELVRTTWDIDHARWKSGRPFRLVLAAGFGPPDRVVLEIRLGPEPGSSTGLELQVISAGF